MSLDTILDMPWEVIGDCARMVTKARLRDHEALSMVLLSKVAALMAGKDPPSIDSLLSQQDAPEKPKQSVDTFVKSMGFDIREK